MGKVTLQLDDDLIRDAEAYSVKLGKSLSEVVADYLADFGHQGQPSKPKKASFFGSMRGTAEVVGDIVSPLPEEDWEVLRS